MNSQGCVLAIKYDKPDFDIWPGMPFLETYTKNPRAPY